MFAGWPGAGCVKADGRGIITEIDATGSALASKLATDSSFSGAVGTWLGGPLGALLRQCGLPDVHLRDGLYFLQRDEGVSKLIAHLSFDGSSWRLWLIDLEAGSALTCENLQQIFDLTASEARIATRLYAGQTIDAVATDCGSSIWTIRKHLAAVFDKTGTRRQAELVSLLARVESVVRARAAATRRSQAVEIQRDMPPVSGAREHGNTSQAWALQP